jgi:hypothetical protein
VANDEHLALLRQGTAIWNGWRERLPDSKPDLYGADLSGANLRGANLSYADLREANFSKANLSKANLCSANLRGANLSWANLSEAALVEAYLRGANLSEVDLSGADLNLTDLLDANLRGADLSGADVGEASVNATNLIGAKLVEAYLLAAHFREADLSGTDLTGAFISDTIFTGVDLTATKGLNECRHGGPSAIDYRTLFLSKNLPLAFLRGCGLPDNLIEYLPSLRGEAIRYYSCFISYSARDQMFAERLHADLQDKGVRCWFAPHDLSIGAKTWDAIDEAIRLRDKLLVVLSKASIGSDWVEDEVSKAYAEERSRKAVVLYPVRIDNAVMSTTEPWAIKLRDQRNIGDFRSWRKPAEYQKSLERLLRDLRTSRTE